MNTKIEDIVDWVLVHRRGKAFEGYTAEQIAADIFLANKVGGFAHVEGPRREILGVVCCTPCPSTRTLHVRHVLTSEPGVLPNLLNSYQQRFKGWALTARRGKGFVRYKTQRLIDLLCKRSKKT